MKKIGHWYIYFTCDINIYILLVFFLQDDGCSLHISQELSKLYPETQSKPILTTESAPGLILSSGTLGMSLKGHVGVYLSADAGVTWHEVSIWHLSFLLHVLLQ